MGDGERARPGAGRVELIDDDPLDFSDTDVLDPVAGPIYGGVDPGKQGFASLLLPDGSVEAWPIPVVGKIYDLGGVARIIRDWKRRGVAMVVVERQQPAYQPPGSKTPANMLVKASFHMGYGYCLWQMGLYMAGISHEVVMPAKWKKAMDLKVPKGATKKQKKAKAIDVCQRLYPRVDLRRSDHHASKPCADKAESILLARYGQLHVGR